MIIEQKIHLLLSPFQNPCSPLLSSGTIIRRISFPSFFFGFVRADLRLKREGSPDG